MSPFETILLEEIARVKAKLKSDETLPGFELTITATGRLDGDVSVDFKVSDKYGLGACTAGSLDAACAEFLRRRGWVARNAPLCLPNVSNKEDASTSEEHS